MEDIFVKFCNSEIYPLLRVFTRVLKRKIRFPPRFDSGSGGRVSFSIGVGVGGVSGANDAGSAKLLEAFRSGDASGFARPCRLPRRPFRLGQRRWSFTTWTLTLLEVV